MLENFHIDEEKTRGNTDVVLQKNFEYTIDKPCEQCKCFRETGNKNNTYTQEQKEFLEHIMRIGGLENLKLTGDTEGKKDSEKQ